LSIRRWDAADGRQLWKTDTRASHLAFGSDGKTIAAAGNYDHCVHVFDATTGHALSSLQGHATKTASVAVNPDGRRMASCADNVVKIWDAASGQELLSLQDPQRHFKTVAFDPTGNRLVGAGYRGMVRVWDARPASAAVRTERAAAGLLRFMRAKSVREGDLDDAIKSDPTIAPSVRRKALELAHGLEK
jgi:WD40 repeat protein